MGASPLVMSGQEVLLEKKTVVFRPATSTDTVKTGYVVCYNYDSVKDFEENTATVNSFSRTATNFAEGSQDFNARFLEVEKPSSGNINHVAGIVAEGYEGKGTGSLIEIYPIREGVVVPVYTDLSVTNGATLLAVKSDSYKLTNPVYGGSSTPCKVLGLALETVDRSSTNGLTWMRGINGLALGLGVSANNLAVGAGATTGEIIPFMISIETAQTGGTFHALRLRGELAGAGSSSGDGGGIALRGEGVVNAATAGNCSAVSSHLIFKTGNTPASGRYAGLWAKVENQDATPADLAAVSICALWLSIQNNDAPTQSTMIYFDSDGSDDPDYLFVAKTAGAISGVVSVTDAPALATGDLMCKILVGSSTYYIPCLQDSGQ